MILEGVAGSAQNYFLTRQGLRAWNRTEGRGRTDWSCFVSNVTQQMKGPIDPGYPCSCRIRYRYCCPFFKTVKNAWPKSCSGFHRVRFK